MSPAHAGTAGGAVGTAAGAGTAGGAVGTAAGAGTAGGAVGTAAGAGTAGGAVGTAAGAGTAGGAVGTAAGAGTAGGAGTAVQTGTAMDAGMAAAGPPAAAPDRLADGGLGRGSPRERKDLQRYLAAWARLSAQRKQVRALIRRVPARPRGRGVAVGGFIGKKLVPRFAKLVQSIEAIRVRTAVVKKIHQRLVAGYRKMLEAYRLAAKSWKADGKGIGRAIAMLRSGRLQVRQGRAQLERLKKALEGSGSG
jgi:hypothetical protein